MKIPFLHEGLASLLEGLASRHLLWGVLIGLPLWGLVAAPFHSLQSFTTFFLGLAVTVLAAHLLLVEKVRPAVSSAPSAVPPELPAASSGPPVPSVEASSIEAPTPPLPAAQPEEGAKETTADAVFLAELTAAHDKAAQELLDIERLLREEQDRRRSTALSSPALVSAGAVRRIAEALVTLLENAGESAAAVRSLRDMAARLQAKIEEVKGGADGGGETIPSLVPPVEWLGENHAEPAAYLSYLEEQVRRFRQRLAADQGMVRSPAAIAWRNDAESLLLLAGGRRSMAGQAEAPLYQSLHEELLTLLGYKEIPVAVGDAIDREFHAVETSQSTDEIGPNRVLIVHSPCYVVGATGEVWRRAKVVMSEQSFR